MKFRFPRKRPRTTTADLIASIFGLVRAHQRKGMACAWIQAEVMRAMAPYPGLSSDEASRHIKAVIAVIIRTPDLTEDGLRSILAEAREEIDR